MGFLQIIINIKSKNNFETRIMAAAITSTEMLEHCLSVGVDEITLPEFVVAEVINTNNYTK